MTDITQLNTAVSSAAVSRQAATLDNTAVAGGKKLDPLLAGTSLTVTTAPASDLERLVARIKSENENSRLALLLTSLSTLNEALTDVQKTNLVKVDALNQSLTGLNADLETQYAQLTEATNQSALMEMKIQQLEAAVERAIQDGKDHNEAVRKAKETRDRAQAALDKLEAAEVKDEAAIAAAEAVLEEAQTTLDEAMALQAQDAAKIQAAQDELADVQKQKAAVDANVSALNQSIADTENEIASVNAQLSSCLSALGEKALANIASALQSTAAQFGGEEAQSPAEEKKVEEKAIANDPLRLIREALERLDEAMAETVGANREAMV